MNDKHKQNAIAILCKHNNTQVVFIPIVNNTYKQNDIHIVTCNAACINDLITSGYSLSLSNGTIHINKY